MNKRLVTRMKIEYVTLRKRRQSSPSDNGFPLDRVNLISHTMTISDYIGTLCEKLDAITAHSYIAKSQARYLANLKENLQDREVILLNDFAENSNFTVKDEIHGYHWNKQSCTLHPIVIYINTGDELVSHSLCILLDDLEHDVSLVWKVIAKSIAYMKEHISTNISRVYYFSDGEWNFFATSHGKSVCDGIGGTVK